jgi:cytochrome c-type biogenesis protein CcmH/NrfF
MLMRRMAAGAALLALLFPTVASAACPRTTLAGIEDTVMCQVCGVPLGLATESPEAARERAFIASVIARCETPGQIRAALVAQYGPSVLALPPQHGFDLAAYLVPLLGVVCAVALVAMVVLAWRNRGRRQPAPAPSQLSATDAARVEAALERFES